MASPAVFFIPLPYKAIFSPVAGQKLQRTQQSHTLSVPEAKAFHAIAAIRQAVKILIQNSEAMKIRLDLDRPVQ